MPVMLLTIFTSYFYNIIVLLSLQTVQHLSNAGVKYNLKIVCMHLSIHKILYKLLLVLITGYSQ